VSLVGFVVVVTEFGMVVRFDVFTVDDALCVGEMEVELAGLTGLGVSLSSEETTLAAHRSTATASIYVCNFDIVNGVKSNCRLESVIKIYFDDIGIGCSI